MKWIALSVMMLSGTANAVYTIGMCTNGYGCGVSGGGAIVSGGFGSSGNFGGSGGGGNSGFNELSNVHEFSPTDTSVIPGDMASYLIWIEVANRVISGAVEPWFDLDDISDVAGPYPPVPDFCDGRFAHEGQLHVISELLPSELAYIEWDVYDTDDLAPGRQWGLGDYGKPDGLYEKFNEDFFWFSCESSGIADPRYKYDCRISVRIPGGVAGRQVNYRVWVSEGEGVDLNHKVVLRSCFQIHEQE